MENPLRRSGRRRTLEVMSLDHERLSGIDPAFVFDYRPLDVDVDIAVDGGADVESVRDAAGTVSAPVVAPRTTTYWDVTKGNRGPQPLPPWVVTDAGAVDNEWGVLKTGKEADVFLVQRSATDGTGHAAVMAAKRYRSTEHRSFHRSTAYTDGRRMKKSRDTRALQRGSRYGRAVAAGQWAFAEFEALKRFWAAGLPVPSPVQLQGTEILMEFIGTGDGVAAPRLAQVKPSAEVLDGYHRQLVSCVTMLASHGVAHGDLSPYNVLADGDDIVVIDMPQVVDLVGNPRGREFLERDCRNMCAWFTSRGLASDPQDLVDHALGALHGSGG
ncbi:MAG: RIO1 family regulatory kinase/ATPase [Ornithinimicrobium sp.]